MNFWGISLTVLGAALATPAAADIRLPRLVGDNMVLQRDRQVKIWGWADPGERVRITFRGQSASARAAKDGTWSVMLSAMKPGGPDDMVLKGKNVIKLSNILVGDVWLASGQSNMEFTVSEADNADDLFTQAIAPHVRVFHASHAVAARPRRDVVGTGWQTVDLTTIKDFSAVGYMFARQLNDRYQVPVGIIQASWGGTGAESWVDHATLARFPEFREASRAAAGITAAQDEALADYQRLKAAWLKLHVTENRGDGSNGPAWSHAQLDDTAWETIDLPMPWDRLGRVFKSFGGTVWFRREVELTPEDAGKDLSLVLGTLGVRDVSFFNGVAIGSMEKYDAPRRYTVPGYLVKPGKNIIAIQLFGDGDRFVGAYGDGPMFAAASSGQIDLGGKWKYRAGPDLSTIPLAPGWTDKLYPFPPAPSVLFNGMIAPLTNYAIKGAIWYQGEDNAARPKQYRTLFPALIANWRAQWGQQFPFLFVQLAGYGANKDDPADYGWAELREAQAMTARQPLNGMAVAIDIGEVADVHPKNKREVAKRLADVAARVAYGDAAAPTNPEYRSLKTESGAIRISIGNAKNLRAKDPYGYVRGFSVAGADGVFKWATGRIAGSEIIVSSPQVANPVAVRYDWANSAIGNVYNEADLPLAPFRSDAPAAP